MTAEHTTKNTINEELRALNEKALALYEGEEGARDLLGHLEAARLLDPRHSDASATLAKNAEKIARMEIEIFVAGPQRVGKTTLLNAIAGTDTLITGRGRRVTAILTVWRHSEKGPLARVHFQHPSRPPEEFDHIRDPAKLRSYCAADGEHTDDVDYVEVFSTDERLRGLCLVDAPGINDVDRRRAEIARKFAPRAHSLVFAISTQSTLGRGDLDFLRTFNEHSTQRGTWRDTFFVLNRIDSVLIPDEEGELDWEALQGVQQSMERALRDEFTDFSGDPPRIFPLCANLAHKDHSWARNSRRFSCLMDHEFDEITKGFDNFYDALRAHIERDETRARFFRQPIDELILLLGDLHRYLAQVKNDSQGSEATLRQAIERYRKMVTSIDSGARKIRDESEDKLLKLERELLGTWEHRTGVVIDSISSDIGGELDRVLRESETRLSKLEPKALEAEIQNLLEHRVLEPNQARVQASIYDRLVDPVVNELERRVLEVARTVIKDATALLGDSTYEGVFDGMSFVSSNREDEVMVEIMGAFARKVKPNTQLFERVSRRTEGAVAGATTGAILGGVVGAFVGGPWGAALGASIGATGGGAAGATVTRAGKQLRTDWIRRSVHATRKDVRRTLEAEFLKRSADLFDNPLSEAKQTLIRECLTPVERSAKAHLENLRSSLMELKSNQRTAKERLEVVEPALAQTQALLTRCQEAVDAFEAGDELS